MTNNQYGQSSQDNTRLDRADVKYVNLELRPSDREPFRQWIEAQKAEFWNLAQRMADDGYKLTMGYDNKYGSMQVTVTCMDKKSNNYGGVMPSRSDDLQEAMWMAMYKHYVICHGEWPLPSDGHKWG